MGLQEDRLIERSYIEEAMCERLLIWPSRIHEAIE